MQESSTQSRWIETRRLSTGHRVFAGVIIATTAFLLALLTLLPVDAGRGWIAIATAFMLAQATLIWVVTATKRIGVGSDGVTVVRYWGSMWFAWSSLRPGTRTPSGEWVRIVGMDPTQKNLRSFWLNREQAAAMLTSADFPRGEDWARYEDWLGLDTLGI